MEKNVKSNDKQTFCAGLKAATSTTLKKKKKKKEKGATRSVKEVKKTSVAKVSPQGGGRCNGF